MKYHGVKFLLNRKTFQHILCYLILILKLIWGILLNVFVKRCVLKYLWQLLMSENTFHPSFLCYFKTDLTPYRLDNRCICLFIYLSIVTHLLDIINFVLRIFFLFVIILDSEKKLSEVLKKRRMPWERGWRNEKKISKISIAKFGFFMLFSHLRN